MGCSSTPCGACCGFSAISIARWRTSVSASGRFTRSRAAADFRIGVMGLGEIGGYIATRLAGLGITFPAGRAVRSSSPASGVITATRRPVNFAELDALINVLPLTEQTRGILARPLLDRLPAGAVLINCGRGEHMVNHDILQALDSGRLAGAVLDVFPVEPLPQDDLLWLHPQVVITTYGLDRASGWLLASCWRTFTASNARYRNNLVDKQRGY